MGGVVTMEQEYVYILTKGEYSDRRIVRVFSTNDLAEEYVRTHPDDSWDGFNEIEEWPLNTAKQQMHVYLVRLSPEGELVEVEERDTRLFGWFSEAMDGTHLLDCWARDADHAVKIVAEKFTRWQVERINDA